MPPQSRHRPVHLVGSAAFASADAAFDAFGAHLSACATRFPDGETGDRRHWIVWQQHVFADHPQFQMTEERVDPRDPDVVFRLFRLRDGVAPDAVQFSSLGYAAAAKSSYRRFAAKLDAGVLPAGSRFLVCLPTPLAVAWAFLPDPADHPSFEPAYERALVDEVAEIAAAIPNDRLAIQWDVAVEMTTLERGAFVGDTTGHRAEMNREFRNMLDDFGGRVARLADHVPAGVDLAIHLCYGDFGHRHSIEPQSLRNCVAMANRLSDAIHRSIELIHMPVPRERSDEAYFEPLRDLTLRPETTLSLGLVHFTDGLEGTRRRMATADKYVRDYGIATECGLGRRAPETMDPLLAIHAQAAKSG